MKFEEIERLVRLVADSGVSEVEIKQGGVQVRVARRLDQPAVPPQVHLGPVPGAAAATALPAAALPVRAGVGEGSGPAPVEAGAGLAAARVPDEPAEALGEGEGLHVIRASMVGTFYRSPTPEASPFVGEGTVVKKGQVIFILEAMKIMNEIESDAAGTVVKVFAEDAQPVEFGEPLLAMRPL